jgi:hypothetical protein
MDDAHKIIHALQVDVAKLNVKRLNCHELLLDCWSQFAQLPDGYATQDLFTLETLEGTLLELQLIDDKGEPIYYALHRAINEARLKVMKLDCVAP